MIDTIERQTIEIAQILISAYDFLIRSTNIKMSNKLNDIFSEMLVSIFHTYQPNLIDGVVIAIKLKHYQPNSLYHGIQVKYEEFFKTLSMHIEQGETDLLRETRLIEEENLDKVCELITARFEQIRHAMTTIALTNEQRLKRNQTQERVKQMLAAIPRRALR